MLRSRPLLAITISLTSFLPSRAPADEVWTYHFIADGSRPYLQSCGECALPYSDTRADVVGSFRILLNWDNGTGRLLDLDDQLVNVAYATYSPTSGTTLHPTSPPYRS